MFPFLVLNMFCLRTTSTFEKYRLPAFLLCVRVWPVTSLHTYMNCSLCDSTQTGSYFCENDDSFWFLGGGRNQWPEIRTKVETPHKTLLSQQVQEHFTVGKTRPLNTSITFASLCLFHTRNANPYLAKLPAKPSTYMCMCVWERQARFASRYNVPRKNLADMIHAKFVLVAVTFSFALNVLLRTVRRRLNSRKVFPLWSVSCLGSKLETWTEQPDSAQESAGMLQRALTMLLKWHLITGLRSCEGQTEWVKSSGRSSVNWFKETRFVFNSSERKYKGTSLSVYEADPNKGACMVWSCNSSVKESPVLETVHQDGVSFLQTSWMTALPWSWPRSTNCRKWICLHFDPHSPIKPVFVSQAPLFALFLLWTFRLSRLFGYSSAQILNKNTFFLFRIRKIWMVKAIIWENSSEDPI